MFTGRLSRGQMAEEHAEELEALETGRVHRDPPPDIIAKRRRVFWPYAAVMTVIMLAGLLYFITFEESAITTVPRLSAAGDIAVDVNPDSGSAENGAALWTQTGCDACHGQDAHGVGDRASFSIAGTALSFESFVISMRRGPAEMPAYGSDQLSGQDLADLWVWLKSLED
jgi:mono/diheme cytochrome c family protein